MHYAIALLFAGLFVKHWLVDFVWQTEEEIKYKGEYQDWRGLKHSLKHGFGTAAVFLIFTDWQWAALSGIVDLLVHYHIDWVKMNFGEKDMQNPRFWAHLGLDQLAHYLTYLGLFLLAAYG